MNAWSKMNDPRETKEWVPSGCRAVGSYTENAMRKRLDDVMRRSARLMSLTDDREPTDDTARAYLFHRGWARAALWSHYASGHAGVCLVLDGAAIQESLDSLSTVHGRYRTCGHLNYVDKPIEINLPGDFDSQASLDEAIEDLLDTRWVISGLHMTKNKDWAYEEEVRIATIDVHADEPDLDTPLSVPLSDALAGVIFGDAHPEPRVVADHIRSAMGARAPEMFVCSWIGGAPELRPLPISP